MNTYAGSSTSPIYFRLIALWVLCEALLGSIIFTFKIPVSGLLIGSCAVVCISLIGWYVPAKGSIIKATVIVAIFKMMLTPQAPPPAYIAVFFQGLLGELFFWNRSYFRFFCVILSVLALVESAFQRVLTITIIYGNDFWIALNNFIKKLSGSDELTNYSYFIILTYVLIHLVAGVMVGLWAGSLPRHIGKMSEVQKKYPVGPINTEISLPVRKRKKRIRLVLFITWIALLLLYFQSTLHIGKSILPSGMVLRILIRSMIIVLTWFFLLGPLIKQLLHKWLQRKKQQSAEQVQQVLNLLPATQGLMIRSWQLSKERKGLQRIFLCCKIILANTFHRSNE